MLSKNKYINKNTKKKYRGGACDDEINCKGCNNWSDYGSCMKNRGKSATNTSLQSAKETGRYVTNTANKAFDEAVNLYNSLQRLLSNVGSDIVNTENLQKRIKLYQTCLQGESPISRMFNEEFVKFNRNFGSLLEKNKIFSNNKIIKLMSECDNLNPEQQKQLLQREFSNQGENIKNIIDSFTGSISESSLSPPQPLTFQGSGKYTIKSKNKKKNKYTAKCKENKQKGGGNLEAGIFIALILIGFSTSPFIMFLFILAGAYPLLGMFMLNPDFFLLLLP